VTAAEFYASRAITPEVATEAGVVESGDVLRYPNGRYRPLDGHTLSERGKKMRPWPIPSSEALTGAEGVVITEGETDGLAARSALVHSPDPPGHGDTPVLAIPGCQYSPETITRGLAHYGVGNAYLAYDPDEPGRKAAARLAGALARAKITAWDATPPRDDLAGWLASVPEAERGEAIANLLADAQLIETGPPSFADIAAEEVTYLWRDRIPLGFLAVLAGNPRQGKSMVSCLIAADVARAGDHVLLANAEDPPSQVRVRLGDLDAAALKRIHPLAFETTSKPSALRAELEGSGAKLLIVDHYRSYAAGAQLDPIRDAYKALPPLPAPDEAELAALGLEYADE
jgi:hypothetical protein